MANKYEYEYETERKRLPTDGGVEVGQVVAALRHWARVKPIGRFEVKWRIDEDSMTPGSKHEKGSLCERLASNRSAFGG